MSGNIKRNSTITDTAGRQSHVALFGDLISENRHDDINLIFNYVLSDYDVTSTVTGSGTNSIDNHQLLCATGASGTAKLTTKDIIRYKTSHDSWAFFTAAFSTPNATSKQYIGPNDSQNGYFVGNEGTNFVVGRIIDGVEHTFPQTDFNIDRLDGTSASEYLIDTTKLNLFRITYGYLGIMDAVFEVWAGLRKGWVAFHFISLGNTQVDNAINNAFLPIQAYVESTTGDVNIRSGSWAGGIVGTHRNPADNRLFATSNTKTIVGSTLTNILTLRSKTTYASITSYIHSDLSFLSMAADGVKPVTISIYRNATLGGTPSYSDVDTTNSTMEVDTAGTTVTGGQLLAQVVVGKVDSEILYFDSGSVSIRPGDSLTFAASSPNASDITVSPRWEELF